MRCEDALNQLNARADAELSPDDAATLDAHLAECAHCRTASERLQSIDADLRRAFVPRRVAAERLAEATLAALGVLTDPILTDTVAPSITPPAAPAPRFAWGQTLLAMAAGFLLAVMVFRPWQPGAGGPIPLRSLEPVARLAVASGPVEVRAAMQPEFLICTPESPIERDSIVRTGPSARCELTLDKGNALRLDCNTEVKLHQGEVVEVSHGRLFACSTADAKPIEFQSAGGTIVPKAAAQVALECQPHTARLIVVQGTADVRAGSQAIEVGPDRKVLISQGKVDDPEKCDPLLETSWVNSLLAIDSSDHPELDARVNRLLAQVGAAKLSLLYEDELRRLGDAGVPPLLAYLVSTRATPNVTQRIVAARIVADVCESRWIAELIELLTDANADVRFHAARGLERLTGRDQGAKPDTWKNASLATCKSAHEKWLAWWAANRDRYPAARREAPAKTPSASY